MSDLENAAKPLMESLILGKAVSLSVAEQELIASWAFLRVVIAEYTEPKELSVPGAHRRWLHKHRRPPRRGVYIWLASYSGERVAGYYEHAPLCRHPRRREAGPTNAYGVTFGIYKALFQVFGSVTEPRNDEIAQGGYLAGSTARIWPPKRPKTVRTPIGTGIDDRSLGYFTSVFSRPPMVTGRPRRH